MTYWFTETLRQPNLKVVFLLKADNTTLLNQLENLRDNLRLWSHYSVKLIYFTP